MTDAQRRRFTDIDPSALQHPMDRIATEQLKKVPLFNILPAMYIKFGVEPIHRVLNDANNVKVGPKQIPNLYRMLHEGCTILDMPEPDLYVSQRPEVNTLTIGHTRPYIIVYSGLLEMMNEEEVMAVIAHELGHIKCEHMLYKMIAQEIDGLIVTATSLLPFGHHGPVIEKTTQLAIKAALLTWERKAELTADRIALLVMQDPRPCISMLAKLAGGTANPAYQLDPSEFLEQARHYKDERNKGGKATNRIYQVLASAYKGTHPFAVERAHYLNEWVDGCVDGRVDTVSEYHRLLKGHYLKISQEGNIYCDKCGKSMKATSKFCSRCGSAL
jgi:Zn-dependent protease with chaperone function